ncbi:Cytochrome c oxidase assembly protein COX15 [Fusarium oxysporum f. sp. albedinis]|nr:Cytochrome c oxidase assembly protein COX15 [Fusarium oxysporum f. sp. albedinis]
MAETKDKEKALADSKQHTACLPASIQTLSLDWIVIRFVARFVSFCFAHSRPTQSIPWSFNLLTAYTLINQSISCEKARRNHGGATHDILSLYVIALYHSVPTSFYPSFNFTSTSTSIISVPTSLDTETDTGLVTWYKLSSERVSLFGTR